MSETWFDTKDVAAIFDAENAEYGPTGGFIKKIAGRNTVRLLPTKDGLYRRLRQNTCKIEEEGGTRFSTTMDMGYITKVEPLLKLALEAGRLSKADVELTDKYGDPFVVAARMMKDAGVDWKDLPDGLNVRTVFVWVAVDRNTGSVGYLETSKAFKDQVEAIVKDKENGYPDLFDPMKGHDLTFNGTGENLSRRYTAPIAHRDGSEAGVLPSQLPGLDELTLSRTVSYKARLDDLMAMHGPECGKYGITRETFGG